MDLSHFTTDMEFSPVFPAEGLLHSYIISGPPDSAKYSLARTLAAAMVCSSGEMRPCGVCRHCLKSKRGIHPDIITVDKQDDKREIFVDQMRDIRSDAVIMPNEADKKVYIINEADALNTSAQNAMLKIFEEPPSHAAFILVCENPLALLPTVRSRCTEIRVVPAQAVPDLEIQELTDEFFDAVLNNGPQLCAFVFRLEKMEKVEFSRLILSAEERAVELLRRELSQEDTGLKADYINKMIDVFRNANEYLKYNVALGHITGMLMASLLTDKAQGGQSHWK